MNDLAVLVCHGFTAQPKTVEYIAPFLERAGLPYAIPTLRGHGTVYTDLEHVRWQDWLEDALAAYDRLAAQHARVAVVGHSMGGLVAAHVAALRPVDSVTLVAIALKFTNPLSVIVNLLAPFVKVWKVAETQLWDANLLEIVKRDPVTYDRFPTRAFAQLWAMAGRTPAMLPRVKARALVIHSLRDETIPPSAADLAFDRLGSVQKRIRWFENSRHEMFWDGERDALCQHIVEFILESQPAQRVVASADHPATLT
jgi:carboxylesterase